MQNTFIEHGHKRVDENVYPDQYDELLKCKYKLDSSFLHVKESSFVGHDWWASSGCDVVGT